MQIQIDHQALVRFSTIVVPVQMECLVLCCVIGGYLLLLVIMQGAQRVMN